MSDALSGVQGLNDLRLRMQRWAQHAPEATKKALMLAADVVIGTSRRDYFAKGGGEGGPLLHVRSGRLTRSLHKTVEVKGSDIKAEVGTNLIYARIHEYGGQIRPIRAEYLAFQVMGAGGARKSAARISGGDWVRTKLVNMPERSYLRSALTKEKANIPRIILAQIMKGWSKFSAAEVGRG